ncbi:hypothetical protein GCM10010371_14010 [Streptomyces subrutilus]|uniref:Uncharacterized protein n=1 Tax=Streptomyces subrutilus TaxID=36818 RepID=A0A918QMK3_9ACTN|nr:hypothetical protein GCM10010371_14010 [Streptomyces subrutilus]
MGTGPRGARRAQRNQGDGPRSTAVGPLLGEAAASRGRDRDGDRDWDGDRDRDRDGTGLGDRDWGGDGTWMGTVPERLGPVVRSPTMTGTDLSGTVVVRSLTAGRVGGLGR